MNEQANRVARHLVELGVGPERVVGVMMHRSADFVTAVLGVLKSGGAYLPLDPAYPADRIAYMVGDAAPMCVLVGTGVDASDLGVPCVAFEVASSVSSDASEGAGSNPSDLSDLS
ncbi:AMP-binding protein, partial [Streptomyces sp. XY431]|uniref:AMP-binding protein n=1 Tax=Streptomyces sp. XY431 TaxID=1415562 RepID=UPI000ABE36C1